MVHILGAFLYCIFQYIWVYLYFYTVYLGVFLYL